MAAPTHTTWWQLIRNLSRQAFAWSRASLADSGIDPFPMRHWLRKLRLGSIKSDLRAGVTVALLDIPQGMAYAAVAGLPLQFGTTCSAVAGIVGSLFSSSRFTVLGPTNATAFMIFSYFAIEPRLDRVAMMPLLVFMVGALLLVGAYLRIADLAQYISRTVVVAYVTGAALLILANQLAHVLGVALRVQLEDGTSYQPRTLPGILFQLARVLPQTHWQSLAIAALTLAAFWLIRRLRPAWPALALALILASLAATVMNHYHLSVPTFADAQFRWYDLLPPFPVFASSRFLADFGRLFGLAAAIAFLATVESSSMAKTMALVRGARPDQNQDMFSLGLANLSCAYFSGMPCSGSLTRSALNYSAGAQTQLAGIINGTCCLIGALTLGGAVAYVPRAALAVLIICVAFSLINTRRIRICLEATGSDATTFIVTLAATLMVPLHVAIFAGVGISLILYLRKASRPMLVEYAFNTEGNLAEAEPGARPYPAISIVHVEGELFFGAADLFRSQIQSACADQNLRIIILRLKNARHLDATSVMALDELIHALRADGRELLISGVQKDIYRVLRNSNMLHVIGKENIFLASPSNPNVATRNALRRAQQILGTSDAEVRIYVDQAKTK